MEETISRCSKATRQKNKRGEIKIWEKQLRV